MRVNRLELTRYGRFDGRSLVLDDPAVRLHLIVGDNEAGKSTARAALGDLLFGIPERSPYNFRHAYRDMAIGGELQSADGRRLAFVRRKARRDSLQDEDDRPLPDDALAPFLAGFERAGFEGMFSLDHDGLRAGGQDMLLARGEVGESLFAATAGLHDLTRQLRALEAEADALFGGRKAASKAYWQAAARVEEARRKLADAALSGDEWKRREDELTALQAGVAERRTSLTDLRTRQSRIARLRGTLAPIRRLEGLRGSLDPVPAAATTAIPSPDTFDKLRLLGYVE